MPQTKRRDGVFPSVEDIIATVGPAAAMLLVELYGGGHLYVPKMIASSGRTTKLSEQIGGAAVSAASKLWGGTYIKVPVAKELRVAVMLEQGVSKHQSKRPATTAVSAC